jgi:hypothetical protein
MARATFGVRAAGDWALRLSSSGRASAARFSSIRALARPSSSCGSSAYMPCRASAYRRSASACLPRPAAATARRARLATVGASSTAWVGLAILALRVQDLARGLPTFWALAPPRNSGAMMATR